MSLSYILHAFSIGMFGIFSVRDCSGNPFLLPLCKKDWNEKPDPKGNGLNLYIRGMGKHKEKQKIDKFRGEFIGKMLMIDIVLNKLLATYISEEKMNYCEFIFTKMDMPSKLDIYKQILKGDKEPSFVEHTYNGMLTDIQAMQKIRNLFAHSMADIDFYGYKNNKRVTSKNISFRNSRNLNKDFFNDIADEYEIKGHKEKLSKLDKIYNALFNVWYYYNRRLPSEN
jgi:hypothetical protein